jgi:transcriptional regulator with XRE-family HTH domain
VAVTQLCPQQLQKYEVGSARPHCFVLQQLADVLGVSVDYLMKGKV